MGHWDLGGKYFDGFDTMSKERPRLKFRLELNLRVAESDGGVELLVLQLGLADGGRVLNK